MGVMKRIALEQTLHGKSLARFAPGEREAIRNLIRGSESLLKFLAEEAAPPPTAGGVQLDEVYLGATYTGFKPERAGVYLVVDLVSETQQVVQLFQAADKSWLLLSIGSAHAEQLEAFSRKFHRWFRLAELSPDDLAFIRRDLPSVAVRGG